MHERKKHVLQIALQLFLEKGFLNTSIQDILQRAKISKGTFYNYFSSKDDCLIAIFEIGRTQTIEQRNQLMHGKQPNDINVFIKQIVVGVQLNYNKSLLPLLETVFQSNNSELKATLRNYHFREMRWMASRLLDVYGNRIEFVKYDLTIMLLGSLQSLHKIWLITLKSPFDMTRALQFLLRQFDLIIPSLIANKDCFMSGDLQNYIRQHIENEVVTQQEVCEAIEKFSAIIGEDATAQSLELLQFLRQQFTSAKPSTVLVKAMLPSFSSSFSTSSFADDALQLTNIIWRYDEEQIIS